MERHPMGNDDKDTVPGPEQESIGKTFTVSGQETKVLAAVRVATKEFIELHNAWIEFQSKVESLTIMQPELLGRSLSQTTETFERLHGIITGASCPSKSEGQPALVGFNMTRASILKKIMDLLVERIR